MNYTQHIFRQSAFNKEASVQVTDETIQLLDKSGAMKREIRFEDVDKLHIYDGGYAFDENKKSFTYVFARIIPKQGKSILFLSSYFLGFGRRKIKARDLSDTFKDVLEELKAEVRRRNPDAVMIEGDRGYSILCYTMSLLFGLGFLVTLPSPIITIYYPRLAKGELWIFWIGMLFACFIFTRFFWYMAQSYAVTRTKLSEE
ncbi:hypothetical protein [Gimesia maris]|uniref:hypothetical protein n=1 Tax=Gimesia maris TaxID=122 RepID=UPI00241F9F39|nr:hypothetical protein [Gimesia maris]